MPLPHVPTIRTHMRGGTCFSGIAPSPPLIVPSPPPPPSSGFDPSGLSGVLLHATQANTTTKETARIWKTYTRFPERMATLHFWFDYSCPYAYLASTQVEALAKKTDATLVWEPMLLGGVFAANDTPQNLMNILSPAKAAHNANDMNRWADIFGVKLNWPSTHPMRTVDALRATLATGIDPKVIH